MQNKRGLSKVITNLLFVLIGIVAVTTIWLVVDTVLLDTTSKISLSSFTIDLEIESAQVNATQKFAKIKVGRNMGEGDIESIKFIIEDHENAEVYEEFLGENDLPELGKRTFIIQLTESFLDLTSIERISIAPVYYTGGSGDLASSKTGSVVDSVEGDLDGGVILEGSDEGGSGGQFCETVDDCQPDTWIGISSCNVNEDVEQTRQTANCDFNICTYSYSAEVKTDCLSGQTCYDGPEGASCLNQQIPCTIEPDDPVCGTDELVGNLKCYDSTPPELVQDYIDYTCSGGFCSSSTSAQTNSSCLEDQICFDSGSGAECYDTPECQNHQDCWDNPSHGPGTVCKDVSGELQCTQEYPLLSGVVNSAWPNNIGEYIDSNDLPTENNIIGPPNYIIFNFSGETRQEGCLQIIDFEYFENSIPYIRLNESITNVTSGDHFQIWETIWSCNVSATF